MEAETRENTEAKTVSLIFASSQAATDNPHPEHANSRTSAMKSPFILLAACIDFRLPACILEEGSWGDQLFFYSLRPCLHLAIAFEKFWSRLLNRIFFLRLLSDQWDVSALTGKSSREKTLQELWVASQNSGAELLTREEACEGWSTSLCAPVLFK